MGKKPMSSQRDPSRCGARMCRVSSQNQACRNTIAKQNAQHLRNTESAQGLPLLSSLPPPLPRKSPEPLSLKEGHVRSQVL